MEEIKEKQEVVEAELRGGEVVQADVWVELKGGDVVWVDVWNVIGVVEEYDEPDKALYLVWPEKGYWPSGKSQPFYPVERKDIHILGPREVLEKMFEVVRKRDAKTAKEITKTLEVAGRASLFGSY